MNDFGLAFDYDANESLGRNKFNNLTTFSLFRLIYTDWNCGDDVGHIRLRRRSGQCRIERPKRPASGSD